MQVVILCGGLGTRLKEETEFRPKPMVNIGNRPILWHIMKLYAHYGFKNFALALGYKGEVVKEYFYHYELSNAALRIKLGVQKEISILGSCDEAGWEVLLADTGLRALKGARLKKMQQFIAGDEFMATYGDCVSDIDLDSLLKFHRKHGKLATVSGINLAARFGELKIKGDRVESFTEKPKTGGGLINGGFFVFDRKVFDYLSENDDCDLEIGALEKIARDGELMVYKHDGFWACMDTARDVDYLNELWNQNKAQWKIW